MPRYDKSSLHDIAKHLLNTCEEQVPPFEPPLPPPGSQRSTRYRPAYQKDKIFKIQAHIIGDCQIDPHKDQRPFQFHIRDLTPQTIQESEKIYLMWAFKHNTMTYPQIHVQQSEKAYHWMKVTVHALEAAYKSIPGKDLGLDAAENACDVFTNENRRLGCYGCALLLFQGEYAVLLGASSGFIHSVSGELFRAHINFVGNLKEKTPDPMNLKNTYDRFFSLNPLGVCQQLVSLLMNYLHLELGIPLIGLYNAAQGPGCSCYLRAAQSAGLLTLEGYDDKNLVKGISEQHEISKSYQMVRQHIQKRIVDYFSCQEDHGISYAFINAEFLRELVMVSFCVRHKAFIPLVEDMVRNQAWDKLKILEVMTLLPEEVVRAAIKVFSSSRLGDTVSKARLPHFLVDFLLDSSRFNPVVHNHPDYKEDGRWSPASTILTESDSDDMEEEEPVVQRTVADQIYPVDASDNRQHQGFGLRQGDNMEQNRMHYSPMPSYNPAGFYTPVSATNDSTADHMEEEEPRADSDEVFLQDTDMDDLDEPPDQNTRLFYTK